jgi:prepilin-type N-terminal cleavage/methylation domain-containing protein
MFQKRRAFTLIELLVVVAIIGGLIAILVPSLSRVRERAKITVCSTQLKGQGLSLAVYAAQFNGLLPLGGDFDVQSNGTWLHDETVAYCDVVINAQTSAANNINSIRKWFYCPSNQEYNLDQLWNTPIAGKRSLGYASLRERALGTPIPGALGPTQRTPPVLYRRKWNPVSSADRQELISDLILTLDPPNPTMSFAPNRATTGVWNTSVSHVKGKKPAGANDLYLDGHVGWNEWKGAAKARWVMCGGGPSGTVHFSFIDP